MPHDKVLRLAAAIDNVLPSGVVRVRDSTSGVDGFDLYGQ